MLMSPNMRRIPSLTHDSCIRPHSTIRIQLMHTVCLVIRLTLSALQTRVALGANTNSLTGLDERNFRPNAECRANDFYSHVSPSSPVPIPQLPNCSTNARKKRTYHAQHKAGNAALPTLQK
jgi:hypothetical protein